MKVVVGGYTLLMIMGFVGLAAAEVLGLVGLRQHRYELFTVLIMFMLLAGAVAAFASAIFAA